jgi:hypothetical protein
VGYAGVETLTVRSMTGGAEAAMSIGAMF